MEKIALTLLEAQVTLYPANAAGVPDLANPIWTGVQAESLSIRERWLKAETRPTGARQPKKHPLVAQYEITLGRVWSLQVPTSDGGLVLGAGNYVLDIVWTDEDSGDWHRETFYNVTVSERSRTSREVDSGFTDEQVFDAGYLAPPTGGAGQVPPITAALPYVVRYVRGTMDQSDLYQYDPVTQQFALLDAGLWGVAVELIYDPEDRSGSLEVVFAGAAAPALQVQADGSLVVAELRQTAPGPGNVPRLDFCYGNVRVASITSGGVLFAASFANTDAPAAGDGKFALWGGGQVRVTLAAEGVVCGQVEEE